jgi:hypothetical protein
MLDSKICFDLSNCSKETLWINGYFIRCNNLFYAFKTRCDYTTNTQTYIDRQLTSDRVILRSGGSIYGVMYDEPIQHSKILTIRNCDY